MSGPSERRTSSSAESKRNEYSLPNARMTRACSSVTTRDPIPLPVSWLSISGTGMRYRNPAASRGRRASFLSASSSTLCRTPTVSGAPQAGHFPPVFNVSSGSRRTPHFRWPSKWYFPSSG